MQLKFKAILWTEHDRTLNRPMTKTLSSPISSIWKVGHSLTTQVWNRGLFSLSTVESLACNQGVLLCWLCKHPTVSRSWYAHPYTCMHTPDSYMMSCVTGASVGVCVTCALSCLLHLHVTLQSFRCFTQWGKGNTKRNLRCHTVLIKENTVQYLCHSAMGQQ